MGDDVKMQCILGLAAQRQELGSPGAGGRGGRLTRWFFQA